MADGLVLIVERTSASNPVEIFGFERFVTCKNGDRVIDDPVSTLGLAERPRVHLVFHAAVGVTQLGWEVGLHERQVAPHVEDLVEDLDVDRADLVAGSTRGARPQLFRGNSVEHPVRWDGDLFVDRDWGRHLWSSGAGHDLAGLQHDLSRVERLAGCVCRAHAGATSAHRAGVGVEELLPGELFDLGNAEGFRFCFEQIRHGLHGALGSVLGAEVHVER